MKRLFAVSVLPFLLLGVTSCTDHSQPNVELIQDFMESPALKAQEFDKESPHNRGMRVPPEGTVPVGFEPYKYGVDVETASRELKNPYAGMMTDDILKVGQKYYNTNCMICHSQSGSHGPEMSVSQFMALKPPTLLSDKVRGWPDGRIYHVITMGQGLMAPYASHIPQKYRWQVVNYIRHLQQTAQ